MTIFEKLTPSMNTPDYGTVNGSMTPQEETTEELGGGQVSTLYREIVDSDDESNNHQDNSRREMLKTVAGVAGNVMEWYDFAVFGYFGDVIGDVFFPPQEGNAALVESFAVFGVAFFMRPLGGMVMGYIGDTYGRKQALEISIFLMAFPTFCMGCLPTYDQVGMLAPILLLSVRLLQGLSVGGQLMSSLVFTLERYPRRTWGLCAACVISAANVGFLVGGLVATFMRYALTDEQLHSWGWRLPFLTGVFAALSGVYLKYYCGEDDTHTGPSENPIWVSFKKENRRALAAASLVPAIYTGGFYVTFVWMAIYMSRLSETPIPSAFMINAMAMLLSVCLFFPVGGILTDKFGTCSIMTIGLLSCTILSPFMVIVIGMGNAYLAFCAQCVMGVTLVLVGAPLFVWLMEAFPPESRLTSVSIGYNIAAAFTSSLSPAMATLMVDTLGVRTPGLLMTFFGVLSLIGYFFVAPPSPEVVSLSEGESESVTSVSEGDSEDEVSMVSTSGIDNGQCREIN